MCGEEVKDCRLSLRESSAAFVERKATMTTKEEAMNEPNQDACQCGGHNTPTFTTRRQFLGRFGMGLGGVALAEMLARESAAAAVDHGILGQPHFPPKAKRIIFLFMSGGP